MITNLKQLIILVFLVLSIPAYAQSGPLRISTQSDAHKNVVFYIQNSSSNNYHIVIDVTKMVNLYCGCVLPFSKNVGQGKTKLFKLFTEDLRGNVDYDYTWSYNAGWANPKIKEKIAYLIPSSSGKSVKTLGISSLKETYGDESDEPEKSGYYGIGFKLDPGDTVFASRRGQVVSIKDGQEPIGENLSYSRARNSIVIRHRDKTLSTYSVLKNGSFFVKPGDPVEAGDPLAIVGGENYAAGPHVRLSTYYLAFDKTQNRGKRYGWAYIKPVFATGNQGNIHLEDGEEYTSLHTQSLIIQEWTKRELKKKGKKKKTR